jgi:acyl-coenzyme A thioesterase PaaI-like protein
MNEGVGQPEGSAGEGFCTIEPPFSDGVSQQERYFHGAAIGAIGDNAVRNPALTLAPPYREVLTVEYKVNLLAPGRGERLVARGEVVTAGRRLFVCRAAGLGRRRGEEKVYAALLQTVSLSPIRV